MKKSSKKQSSSAAATKNDLMKVKSDLTSRIAKVESKLTSQIVGVESKLTSQIVEAKSELIRYIDLKHEELLYDFRGIFADRTAQQNDKIADHEHRIHRVERKVGLAA